MGFEDLGGLIHSFFDKAGKNPESALANVPQEKFNSRYADPNHPAASGSLISFVSGGRLVPGPNSRGLVGGIASVVGQAVRGEHQGAEREQYKNQTAGGQLYDDPYSRHYRGRSWRRARNDSDIRIGPISTPVSVYQKLMKKVSRLFTFPRVWRPQIS